MTDKEKIKALVDLIDEICKDQRDRHVDDSVCGLCEYDGAYRGESGDWMNECPGFEKDDCFCLKKSFREKYLEAGEQNERPDQQTEAD